MKTLLALLVLGAATATPLPKSAELIVVPAGPNVQGPSFGNIKVTFTDGHAEMWTKQGKALFPKVSTTGMVGFVLFTKLYQNYLPQTDDLRIVWPDEHHKDYPSLTNKPFIEEWGFADNNATVIVKSRGTHGPAEFLKYNIATGKLIAKADVVAGQTLPDWAQPYADPN